MEVTKILNINFLALLLSKHRELHVTFCGNGRQITGIQILKDLTTCRNDENSHQNLIFSSSNSP
jgi:hypothetical protein